MLLLIGLNMRMPAQTVRHRTDAKLYRLQTPQTPIARTKRYDEYHMDEFPSGTNMIVAVLAYTGACSSASPSQRAWFWTCCSCAGLMHHCVVCDL